MDSRRHFYIFNVKISLILISASLGFSQLVKDSSNFNKNYVQLNNVSQPLVYTESFSGNHSAFSGATASMNSREFSNDSTIGTVIGIGAEFVGDFVKDMLSPNSPETDAAELERSRR